jgi:hypothetical protein
LKYQHEQAYLLAKGKPPLPENPLPDVQRLFYTGNKLHPTQKAVTSLIPLVRTYSLPGELVLDPFCGSASTCAAALLTGRRYIGIEVDSEYHDNATARMQRIHERIAAKRSSYSIPREGDFACVPTRLKACTHFCKEKDGALTRASPARSLLAIVGMPYSARFRAIHLSSALGRCSLSCGFIRSPTFHFRPALPLRLRNCLAGFRT